MPGTTNFVQFNPLAANQESDSAYNADALRANGAASGAICPSPTFNKFAYQISTFVTALAVMLANKNYSASDGSSSPSTALVNLTGVLANIMTAADMAPFALLDSPIFVNNPQAPTPASNNNSTRLATTAFVQALLSLIGFGGKLFQAGGVTGAGLSVTFPIPFSAIPVVLAVGVGGSVDISTASPTGFTVDRAATAGFQWMAFGSR